MVDPSRLVEIHPERVGATSSPHFPNHSAAHGSSSTDHSWSLERFQKDMQLRVTRLSDWRIEYDLVGVDASIANAIRRVLMAEVPTVAIESVYVSDNTSIVVDEVLSHRLGLVPLRVDPDKLDFRELGDDPTDRNTLVFKLNVACERRREEAPGAPSEVIGSKVLSGDVEWVPQVSQAEEFGDEPPRPVHKDILLAKLRPGQAVNMELHCVKGVGKDHAKFSPVSTASYRLLPHIDIPEPLAIASEDIPKFVGCFPPGVIGVRRHKASGRDEVFVKNARKDTVSREVLRHKEFDGKVKLGRIRDHFLFDIESTGSMQPETLLPAAVHVLLDKIRAVRRSVERLEQQHGGAAAAVDFLPTSTPQR